jgi:hypothetical protein
MVMQYHFVADDDRLAAAVTADWAAGRRSSGRTSPASPKHRTWVLPSDSMEWALPPTLGYEEITSLQSTLSYSVESFGGALNG